MKHTKPVVVSLLFFSSQLLAKVECDNAPKKETKLERESFVIEAAKRPICAASAKVMTAIAYASTESPQQWKVEKIIRIPEGWSYYTHSQREIVGFYNRRVYDPVLIPDPNNPDRIAEVRMKIEALANPFAIFTHSRVGAQLDVTIVPLEECADGFPEKHQLSLQKR